METAIGTSAAHAQMIASLEAVAESGQDIVPLYFARFFASHPAERANFHNAASSQGTMVNEIMNMLLALAAEEPWVEMFMRAQLRTHDDRGDIVLERYRDSLDLFVDVLADVAGLRWTAAWDACWREQTASLFAIITRYY